jgi:hypothetical protein
MALKAAQVGNNKYLPSWFNTPGTADMMSESWARSGPKTVDLAVLGKGRFEIVR